MVGLATGCACPPPGHQFTGGVRAESVAICSVFIELYGTQLDEYVVFLSQIPNKTVFFDMKEYLLAGSRV